MKFIKHLAVVALSLLFCFSAFADKLKVGFVYIGPVGDHGWTYMHEQGRLAVKKEFGDNIYEKNLLQTNHLASIVFNNKTSRIN